MQPASQKANSANRPPRAMKGQLRAALRAGPGAALSAYLKILQALRMGRIARSHWKAFAAFWVLTALAGMVWPRRVPPPDTPPPGVLSAPWWTAPVEFNAWKKYPALENATINVSEIDSATQRVWIAGDSGLLAHSDDRGASWALLSYDTQYGCFHTTGVPCPAPQAASKPQVSPASRTSVTAPPGKTPAPRTDGGTIQPTLERRSSAAGETRNPSVQQFVPNANNAAKPPDINSMTVSILSPRNGDTLSGTVTVSAAVSQYSGPVKMEFRLGMKNVIGAATSPPYTILVDTTKLPNGKYELTVTAVSGDGYTTTSAPVVIVISNGKKAAAAAAAFRATPKEYFGGRLLAASFSPGGVAEKIPPKKAPTSKAAGQTASNPHAVQPANPPAREAAPPAWLKSRIPDIIGLDIDVKPRALLLARDGRLFVSSDNGRTWTLSERLGASGNIRPGGGLVLKHRVGRRFFFIQESPGGEPSANSRADQRVVLAGSRSFEAPAGPAGVELLDGGKQIGAKPLPGEVVQAVAAASDAKHLWFAARTADGTSHIERSDDLGNQWTVEFQTKAFTVRDISFDAAGQLGFAAGDLGAILRTTNAGNTWTPLTRGAADPDRERAAEKTNAANRSGAEDWDDLLFTHYWKLPPPWTFVVLLLALGAVTPAIALAWAPVTQQPGAQTIVDFLTWWGRGEAGAAADAERPSVANEALSDRPLEDEDADQLQFTLLARGLSGFLSNPKTLLPVTIAIQGGWGTGKSSLMNLLRRELRAIQFRPVWFNAWHHQEDENLLASLLQTVRSEAVPGLFTTMGLWFRVRLAWLRAARNLQGIFAMLFVLMVLCGAESYWHRISHDALRAAMDSWNAKIQEQASKIGGEAKKSGQAAKTQPAAVDNSQAGAKPGAAAPSAPGTPAPGSGQPEKPAGSLLGYVLALLVNFYSLLHTLFEPVESLSFGTYVTGPLPALYVLFRVLPSALKQLRAFGENPANLLHTAAPGASDKQLDAQTSFRGRFAKQFEDVTLALGDSHRLVIFVDDLDRCRPAKAGELLEDLNYVINAGPCAMVLGIEPQAVRTALGLNFRETAEEREEAAGPDLLAAAHAKRATFADRYIEKLINIELNVPKPTEAELARLLQAAQLRQPTPSQRRAQAMVRWGRRLEPVLVGLILSAIGWGAGEGAVSFANWRAVVRQENMARSSAGNPPAASPASSEPLRAAPAQSPEAAGSSIAGQISAGQAGAALPAADNRPALLLPAVTDAQSPFPGLWLKSWRFWVTLPAFLLALLWPATRERRALARDSQRFNDARQIWAPVIIQRYQTPRAIKRFMNHVRYLAMLEHPPKQPLSFLEQLLADRAPEAGPETEGIPEDVLVALASLEAVWPAEAFDSPASFSAFLAKQRTLLPEAIRSSVDEAWGNHQKFFGDRHRPLDYLPAYADLRRGIPSSRSVKASSGAGEAGKVEAATG